MDGENTPTIQMKTTAILTRHTISMAIVRKHMSENDTETMAIRQTIGPTRVKLTSSQECGVGTHNQMKTTMMPVSSLDTEIEYELPKSSLRWSLEKTSMTMTWK